MIMNTSNNSTLSCSNVTLKWSESRFNNKQISPLVMLRSKLFSLSTITYISCMNQTFTLTYSWTLNQISNSVNKSLIDLTQNPTSHLSELVMQANTLLYGLFEFNLEVKMVTSKENNNGLLPPSMSSFIKTYIQIIPSGIVVNAIENGISSILIGLQQNFTLNPSKYSFDLDNLITPSQILQFKFYCTTILFNSTLNQSQEDLFSIKNSGISSSLSRNRTCFDSISKIIFI
jgi:hypothetical protein